MSSLEHDSGLEMNEDQIGYAVEPLTSCPHLDTVQPLKNPIDVKSLCKGCGTDKENWICLTCYEVNCGRFVAGDAVSHYEVNQHPMVLSFSDLSVWCYVCEAYVHNDRLSEVKQSAHASKFLS